MLQRYLSLVSTVINPLSSIVQGTLGMLPEVELLCQALMQQEGITFAMPGRRLQGTAFATEIQVRPSAAPMPPGRTHHKLPSARLLSDMSLCKAQNQLYSQVSPHPFERRLACQLLNCL